MNTVSNWLTTLALLPGPTYAQQPPDVVNSDAYANTAMGSSALLHLTPCYLRSGIDPPLPMRSLH